MTYHLLPSELLQRRVVVHLVGCGGNGSQILTGLARLDRALRSCGHPAGLEVVAYDPKAVTEPNVARQLFAPADVGHPKVVVLIHRLNAYYGLDWEAEPSYYGGAPLVENQYFGQRVVSRQAPDILITCVDTAAARREIHQRITEHGWGSRATPAYWLDLGNRQTDGQVILGQPQDRLNARVGSSGDLAGGGLKEAYRNGVPLRLPTVTEIFPELLDPGIPEDDRPSCSLAEALESQDLFINQHVATWALQLLWTLFRKGRIAHHGAFINLLDGMVTPLPVPSAQPVTARKGKAA